MARACVVLGLGRMKVRGLGPSSQPNQPVQRAVALLLNQERCTPVPGKKHAGSIQNQSTPETHGRFGLGSSASSGV